MTHALRHQHTIAETVSVAGFGYWSGQDVRVEFRPANVDVGIVFVRSDLDAPRRVPAMVDHRLEVPRRTNLAAGGTSVEMVEHVMAALAGMRIDNCEVWVNRAEMPGCDGSSQRFVEALCRAGRVQQTAWRASRTVPSPMRVGDEQAWVEARPSETEGLSICCYLDYGAGPIGKQTIELQLTPNVFRAELAAARTFILQPEAEWLRKQGLGKRVTCGDLLVFDAEGPIDNHLRFEDECVRHKALDLIGDLALAGCDVRGRIIAYRSGHRLNAQLVRKLLAGAPMTKELRDVA